MFSKTRNLIQEVFNCTIANQYGCNEVNSIAYECECGNLHLMQDCTYTELFYNGKKALYGERMTVNHDVTGSSPVGGATTE